MSLQSARRKARIEGLIDNDNDLKESTRKGKRFMIKHNDKWIHFGLWPFSGHGTYLDHGDDSIRKAWKARHSVNKNNNGIPFYNDRNSPLYYAWHILW